MQPVLLSPGPWSSAAATMHAYAAHRFWNGAGFSAVVADPGLVDTTLNREWPPLLRGAYVARGFTRPLFGLS
jgi:hypothetical protein